MQNFVVSRAADCISVRDYNYHRYIERSEEHFVKNVEKKLVRAYVLVYLDNGEVGKIEAHYKMKDRWIRQWFCICGKKSPEDTVFYKEWEKVEYH